MKPLTWARVVFSRRADAVKRGMDHVHLQRLAQVIQVIKNGPADGRFAGYDADGSPLHQMTGMDTHGVYHVAFWPIGRVLRIAMIEIRDWEPLER